MISATYDDSLARVRISVTDLATSTVERSLDGVHWEFVRGMSEATTAPFLVDDYEFTAGVSNQYRDSGGNTVSVTPVMLNAWIKVIGAPYLNQRLHLTGWDEVTRSSRSGIFEVQGRSDPVVLMDVHSSRSTSITVRTPDISSRDTLDSSLNSGQILFLHTPTSSPLPSMYVAALDYSYVRPTQRSVVSVWTIPLREVGKPGPSVAGFASSWQTVVSTWTTWDLTAADNATYGDLSEIIGSPTDIIVG